MKGFFFFLISAQAIATSYKNHIEPIVSKKCANCHRGPYLDLRTYPFFWDRSKSQEALVREMIRRLKLKTWKRMPPVNFEALSPMEIALLEAWLEEGLEE